MRTQTVLSLLALSAMLSVTPAHAAPPPTGPAGRKCEMPRMDYPNDQTGYETNYLSAGPLYPGESGTLVCSLHENNNTPSGSAILSESYADPSGDVIVVPAHPVTYPATAAD